jgi:hypothetical protein
MYTAQKEEKGFTSFGYNDDEYWAIYDPDCNLICTILLEEEALALLSHLNRG